MVDSIHNNGKAVKFLDREPAVIEKPVNNGLVKEKVETKKPRSRKPKGLILALVGIGAIAAGVSGYRWWEYASTHETTDNAYVSGHIHPVSSRIAGTVTKVAVDDNQKINAGQLLVALDPNDNQVKVAQAQAALEAAKRQANAAQANITLAAQTSAAKSTQAGGDISSATAAIATAQATVSEAQAGLSSAKAQVAQAEATLQKTQKNYQRYQTLYQQGAIPQQQLDDAQAAYQVAQSEKAAAEQGVQQAIAKITQAQQGVQQATAQLAATKGELQQASASQQQTEVNRSQYAAAQAAIAQAQASLQDTQLQAGYTNITASASGVIGNKSVEVGQRVQPGTPLMAIVSQDYWVTANFKETQLEKIKPGETVEVKLDALGDITFKGRVDSISPASGAKFSLLPPDNATGNFTKIVQRIPVKITLDPQSVKGYQSRISPGMSAEVSVELPKQ